MKAGVEHDTNGVHELLTVSWWTLRTSARAVSEEVS